MGTRSLLILSISLLLSAQQLDMKLLSQSNYLDVVTLKEGTGYISYLKELPRHEHYVATPLDKAVFTPHWNFYPHQASGQVIAVTELAPSQEWFNASLYNTLSLQGSCKGCKVALADKILFSKEDNYIIGDFQQTIDLDPLRKRIDLRHLKYLVLITKERDALDLSSVTFENRFAQTAEHKEKQSVWIWKSQDIDHALLHKNKIGRVYLQIDDGFEQQAKRLFDEGFEVYGLDGDPHDTLDPKRLRKDLGRIARLNAAKRVISGFQIDVEPHVLKDFNIRQERYLHAFVTMVTELTALAHRHTLAFSVVTPFWYDTLYYKGRPLVYHVIDTADETVLMSYRSDPNSVLRISADELAYASAQGKKVQIGVELMPIADERHTLYAIETSRPCIAQKHLQQECHMLKEQEHYIVKGRTLSLYGQPASLETLLATPIEYPAFEGFVLHHAKGLQ